MRSGLRSRATLLFAPTSTTEGVEMTHRRVAFSMGLSCVCFSAVPPAPVRVNEPARARGAMSRAGLPDRRVADRVASAGLSEEGLEEGLASVSRPSFALLPAVVGGTGTCPGIQPFR
eukprot:scaffold74431_cov69-Phaeocystis_antarctica.AAC.1